MEKQFKVQLWEEMGGFVYIMAETLEEAKKKAHDILENDGIDGFGNNFDPTHRETDVLDVEEIGEE